MSAPVKTWQVPEEIERLLTIYRGLAPKRVLEVGSYEGGVLWELAQAATPGTRIVSLDLAAPNQDLYGSWCPEGVEIVTVLGDSMDGWIFEQVRDLGPYDFVFIDAAHDEVSVRSDWTLYGGLSTPNGVVAFHDIHHDEDNPATWDSCEVWKLWREIVADGYLTEEIIHNRAQQCFGIGVVFK